MSNSHSTYAVRVSHLTDAEVQQLKAFSDQLTGARGTAVRDGALGAIPDYAASRLLVKVSGYNNVAPYVRAAPGAKRIVDVLGKDSFALFGGLLAVGLQAYEDSQRTDLDGAQKLGRVSLALLGASVPPLGLVMLGAAIVFPEQYDDITAAAFSDRNPAVQWLGGVIVRYGGKPFERWSSQPSLIDLF